MRGIPSPLSWFGKALQKRWHLVAPTEISVGREGECQGEGVSEKRVLRSGGNTRNVLKMSGSWIRPHQNTKGGIWQVMSF